MLTKRAKRILNKKADHIKVIKVPKRKGGHRLVFIPSEELKDVLRFILRRLEEEETLRASPFAFAFVPYRNVIDPQ